MAEGVMAKFLRYLLISMTLSMTVLSAYTAAAAPPDPCFEPPDPCFDF
jgi:hypothetical protein